jgi:hypothetical protein
MTFEWSTTPSPFVLSLSKDEASNLYFDIDPPGDSTNGFISFKGVMLHSYATTL